MIFRRGLPRMWDWVIATAVLMLFIWHAAPQQLEVIVYKAALVALAACIAYWVDRSMYLYLAFKGRVDQDMERDAFGAARIISRALIFLGVVLGLTLGV